MDKFGEYTNLYVEVQRKVNPNDVLHNLLQILEDLPALDSMFGYPDAANHGPSVEPPTVRHRSNLERNKILIPDS